MKKPRKFVYGVALEVLGVGEVVVSARYISLWELYQDALDEIERMREVYKNQKHYQVQDYVTVIELNDSAGVPRP